MNHQQLLRWIKALESGKYSQGTRQLRRWDGEKFCYCPLGVLADTLGVEWRYDDDSRSYGFYHPWRKLQDEFYIYTLPDEMCPATIVRLVIPLNDIDKISFSEIARVLRTYVVSHS